MSGTLKYDVVIAGAGPAGSTAGYLLSKSGLKVLIIDKAAFPRKKLCGGLITFKTVKLLERVFGETIDSLKNQNIINFESNRYEFFQKSNLLLQRDITIPFRFIDRYSYDHHLLKKSQQAGVDLVEGDGVISLDVLKSMVTTRSGRKFSADIIIGADGVNSRIRRNFLVDLFGRDDWSGNLAAAHEIFLNRTAVKKQIDHPILFFDYIDRGYAWIFPNREILNIGMFALNKGNRKGILRAFRNFLSDMNLHGAQEQKISSYVLPYGSFLTSPVFRNVILVGDAAGFADPLLGEGIFYAQRSAELASQAILKAKQKRENLMDVQHQIENHYLHLLQKYIFPELEYAGKIRHAIFTYYNKFRYLPLKILMSILGDKPAETVHGIRSYKWMKKQAEV
jgi:geranylgeranyl reductase family protein